MYNSVTKSVNVKNVNNNIHWLLAVKFAGSVSNN